LSADDCIIVLTNKKSKSREKKSVTEAKKTELQQKKEKKMRKMCFHKVGHLQ